MKKSTQFIFGFGIGVIVALAIGFIVIQIYFVDETKHPLSSPSLPSPLSSSFTLVDETKHIELGAYWHISTILEKGTKIDVTIRVTEGGPVDVLLLDSGQFLNFQRFVEGKETTAQFYKTGSALNVKSKAYTFSVPEDDRWFIVINNSGKMQDGAHSIGDVSVYIKVVVTVTV